MKNVIVYFADGHVENLVFWRTYHKGGDDFLIEFYTSVGKYIYQNFMGDDGIRKHVFGKYEKEMDDRGCIKEILVPCEIVSFVVSLRMGC